MEEREGNKIEEKKEVIFTGSQNFRARWNIGIYLGKSFFPPDFYFGFYFVQLTPRLIFCITAAQCQQEIAFIRGALSDLST